MDGSFILFFIGNGLDFLDFISLSIYFLEISKSSAAETGIGGGLNVLTNLLLLSSLLSLIIGAIVGLSQTRIKRLLAYSTINHVGFLLLALAVFTNFSIESFIFYIVQYTLTNLNIFLIILALSYIINKSIENYFFSGSASKPCLTTDNNSVQNSAAVRTDVRHTKHIKINI